jgi:hypothetical protein
MMLLLVAGAAALVAPGSRPSGAVACRGATYDYCVQALGCTAEEAGKVERSLLADMAKYMTYAKAEERCVRLQSTLDLSDSELKKVVMRFPSLLGYKVEATLEPKLQWLQNRLDLDEAQLRKLVMTLPQLLGYSVENNIALKLEWLRTRLELDDAGLRKMVLALPNLLSYSVEDNLAPKLEWLRRRLDLDDAGLRRVVLGRPQLFCLSVEDNLAPTLDWLQTRLDLDDAGLRKVVLVKPQLLGYSVEDNMEPKLEWLQKRLDLDDAGLRMMVLRKPQVLGYSIKDKMVPTLDWLQDRLELDAAQLNKMVLRLPAVLGYSVEDNLAPTLDWLQTRLGLDDAGLRKIVVTCPQLLCLSVEANMAPKLGFFEEELGLSPSDVRASIVAAPNRLGYSLKTRFRPRLEVCRAAGVDASLVLSYATIVDEKFCKRVGVPLEALRAAQEKRPPGYRRPLRSYDVTVAVASCAPFLVPPRPRRRTALGALKGDSTITVLHQFESVVLDPVLASDGNFWIYALVVVEQGGFPLHVLGDPEASAADLLMCGGADETDTYDYEGVVFEATPVDAPPGRAAALVVADATFAAMPEAAWRRFGTVIAVGGETDYGDEDAGLIAVSSMGELRALTICSYASLNKRA